MDKKNTRTTNALMNEIIHYHLRQPYGELNDSLDMDYLINKYHVFPNEAVYVVDCKLALLEPLTRNFNKIIGIDRKNNKDISLLSEHVDQSNMIAFHYWVMNNIKFLFDQSSGVQAENDVFKCVYQTIDNRVLLKCTTGLVFDSAGKMRYTLGKLIDLTGLISFQHFGYQFIGPNKDKFYENYRSGRDHECVLTKREKEIILLLRKHHTSHEIASKLYISVHTVDTHRRNIIEKMETNSATEAYSKCKNLGWL